MGRVYRSHMNDTSVRMINNWKPEVGSLPEKMARILALLHAA